MAFHWTGVVLALALFLSGLVMTRLAPGSATQFELYQLHKALGVTILAMTLARLAWRFLRPPPPLVPEDVHMGNAIARLVHRLLYLCLVLIALLGWALVSVSTLNIPTSLFGIAVVPHVPLLADLDAATRSRIEPLLARAHVWAAYALAGLALLHSGAAIWHGPRVLSRMAPGPAAQRDSA